MAEKARAVAGTDKVEINLAVDPSLIGGFVLSVGSKVIASANARIAVLNASQPLNSLAAAAWSSPSY